MSVFLFIFYFLHFIISLSKCEMGRIFCLSVVSLPFKNETFVFGLGRGWGGGGGGGDEGVEKSENK